MTPPPEIFPSVLKISGSDHTLLQIFGIMKSPSSLLSRGLEAEG
jgi:hypothetical protein